MPDDNVGEGNSRTDTSRKVQARARVWRACEVCRKRKVKCNGQEPCAYCLSSGKVCSFKDINDNAASARQQTNSVEMRLAKVEDTIQKLIPVAEAFDSWQRTNNSSSNLPFRIESETAPTNSQSSYPTRSFLEDDRSSSSTSYHASTAIRDLCANEMPESQYSNTEYMDENTPHEPKSWSDRYPHLTKDSHGHPRYTGGVPSLMLLDALTSLRNQSPPADTSAESTDSTKADIQLPFFSPKRTIRKQLALPSVEEIIYPSSIQADELVSTYFARIHHTFPILHQQSFVERYMKTMEDQFRGKSCEDYAFLSTLFAVFACGACLIERDRLRSAGQSEQKEFGGLEFYEQAQVLLWMGSGASQIEQVQCLSIMAICNATWNTLAQSWLNVGAAIRRAQDLGLHLSGRRLPLTPFERELRRRVWWCVYSLDCFLSIALGRPTGTHHGDFDVDMPSELDDAQLTALRDGVSTVASTPSHKSFMTGFVSLSGIHIVAGKIRRFMQTANIRNVKNEVTSQAIMDLDSELANWIHQLPSDVRPAMDDSTNPQMLALCLAAFFVYYSAIINLHHPFIPDPLTVSSDLTSLSQCLSAARSCIRLGEIIQEMLPASHHLAFIVQHITLSAVLLLRSIAYVNQSDLVSAILSDSEKAIRVLEGMETIWSGSIRCREIVSELLVVVKTRLHGGTSAIEALQATQTRPQPESRGRTVGGKRKRASEPGPMPSSSRQRPDDWGSISAPVMSQHRSSPSSEHEDEGRYDRRFYSMRTSSLRTSMADDGGSSPHPSVDVLRGDTLSNVRNDPDIHSPLPVNYQTLAALQSHSDGPEHVKLRQISLEINALSTRNYRIEEYSGHDFIGDDVSALLDHLVKPIAQPTPQIFDVLWQAFHGKSAAPLTV